MLEQSAPMSIGSDIPTGPDHNNYDDLYNKYFTQGLITVENKNFISPVVADKHKDFLQLIGPGQYLVYNCKFGREGLDPEEWDELASALRGCDVIWYRCNFHHNGKAVLAANGDHNVFDLNRGSRHMFIECKFFNCSRRSVYHRVGQFYMINCWVKNWGMDENFYLKSYGTRIDNLAQGMIVNTIFEQEDLWTCIKRKSFWKDLVNHTLFPFLGPGFRRAAYSERKGQLMCHSCYKNRWWLYIENHQGEYMDETAVLTLKAHLDEVCGA